MKLIEWELTMHNVRLYTGYDRAFDWISDDQLNFIGYLNDHETLTLDIQKLKQLFNSVRSFGEFEEIVGSLNGVFSVIYSTDEYIYAACCPIRFFPLFYGINSIGELVIGDDIVRIQEACKKNTIDQLAKLEFLSAGFTSGRRTIYEGIYQLRPGEMLRYVQSNIDTQYYYHFSKTENDISKECTEALEAKACEIIDRVFVGLLTNLKKNPIALPLSGGYDSRLIACKLKEFGFEDVICFTYGRYTKEVEISERVAKALGYEWYFVEYTDDLIRDFHKSEEFESYYEYAARGNTMFYLQEYPAIKYLLGKKIISSDFVCLPGHSGDFLRGDFLSKFYPKDISSGKMPVLLLKKKYTYSWLTSSEKKIIKKALKEHLYELQYTSGLLPYSILEDWELKERTSKYIFNSSHAFTFFGIQTFFPFADRELYGFFHSLPFGEREYGKLYKKLVSEKYFMPANVNFKDEIGTNKYHIILSSLKAGIRSFLPLKIKQQLLLKNDWPYYKPMTDILVKDLEQSNIKIKENGSSYLSRILHWYLLQIEKKLLKNNSL